MKKKGRKRKKQARPNQTDLNQTNQPTHQHKTKQIIQKEKTTKTTKHPSVVRGCYYGNYFRN